MVYQAHLGTPPKLAKKDLKRAWHPLKPGWHLAKRDLAPPQVQMARAKVRLGHTQANRPRLKTSQL